MRRILIAVVVAALGAGLVAGCGRFRDARDPESAAEDSEVVAALSPESAALVAVGFSTEDVATDDPVAADEPKPADGERWRNWRARHAVRVALRHNLMHGELVVQTPDGPRTVLVQRGEVTEISDTGLTVKSADGFSQSWTYASDLRVIESRSTITPRELQVGATVGVAGVEVNGQPTARLVVIPKS
ncbi:MAG: hypothetical protein IRZ05_20825 [Micromonosporaceae bacterium]|nr:hypothetical protein [Micromonosporaceae bacterium]